jgi:hypothetical protein
MEIVLQWLDDLDDLMHVAAFRWEALRRVCLSLGLVAAALLAAGEADGAAAPWLPSLAVLALLSVLVWGAGLGAFLMAMRRERGRTPA